MAVTANQVRNRSFVGRGTLYIRRKGVNEGFTTLGNADSVQFAINESKISQRDYGTPGGGNISSQSSITDVTASVNALSVQPNTLAVALRALVNTNEGAAQSSEAHAAYKNGFIPLIFTPDTSVEVSVTGTGGTPAYVEGTDYEVRTGGVFIIESGSIVDSVAGADNVEVTYTSTTTFDIEGITLSAVDYEVFFDGFNEADNGKSVTMKCHKVTFSPASALDLITEEYGALPLTFEVLADGSITTQGESKYFVVKLAE